MKMLSKEQMKNVMGGVREGGDEGALCLIWTAGSDGVRTYTHVHFNATGSAASDRANSYCVDLIVTQGSGVYHCGYDCDNGYPDPEPV